MKKFRSAENIAEGSVPDGLDACVTDAADLCPVSIITLET